MTAREIQLLSILRPGDMVRFVYQPNRQGMVAFHVEGAAASGEESSLLSDRLGLILKGFRLEGYQFEGRSVHDARCRTRKPRRSHAAWVAVRPCVSPEETPGATGRLGFGVQINPDPPVEQVRVPGFPPSSQPQFGTSVTGLISAVPKIERLEVEFVRWMLPGEAIKALERALHVQVVGQGSMARADTPPLTQLFLAGWLWYRSGWEVSVRALLSQRDGSADGLLGLIGRDLFRCECEIVGEPRIAGEDGDLDLVSKFPEGWHFPSLIPSNSDFETLRASRLHNAKPPYLPKTGLKIGVAEGREVRLPLESRDRHTYIVGGTGTGKTTLMRRIIAEDIKRGEGVVLLDPHGDLYQSVLESIPASRRDDVFCLDPAAGGKLPGLNILDLPESRLRSRQASFIVGELFRFFEENWNMRYAGGPTFEMYFRNTLLLMCLRDEDYFKAKEEKKTAETAAEVTARRALRKIMHEPEEEEVPECPLPNDRPLSLKDFTRVMTDKEFREALLERCPDASVVDFWRNVATKTTGDYQMANFVPYVTSKVNALVQTGFLSDLLCAPRNDLRIGERMNRGEIVLVNLNKGLLGGYESRLLGTILLMEVFAAGLQRSQLPEKERRPVNIHVDEFQNFVSDNVASMLSEARKFGLRLTLANQTLAQLKANAGRQDLLEAVLGNVGNIILFRLGVPDAERLKLFTEPFSRQEMQELPNFHALVRLLTLEGPIPPFVMQTLKM